jgi:hypothetical protein
MFVEMCKSLTSVYHGIYRKPPRIVFAATTRVTPATGRHGQKKMKKETESQEIRHAEDQSPNQRKPSLQRVSTDGLAKLLSQEEESLSHVSCRVLVNIQLPK